MSHLPHSHLVHLAPSSPLPKLLPQRHHHRPILTPQNTHFSSSVMTLHIFHARVDQNTDVAMVKSFSSNVAFQSVSCSKYVKMPWSSSQAHSLTKHHLLIGTHLLAKSHPMPYNQARVPATRPVPNFFLATRTQPKLFFKISEFRVFLSKLIPSRPLQIF